MLFKSCNFLQKLLLINGLLFLKYHTSLIIASKNETKEHYDFKNYTLGYNFVIS